jgi:RNase P/RNase MRP subunit p29
MNKAYSRWVGHQVVLQIQAGESEVPIRGRVVNESSNAVRFRLDGRWDVDIFKEMIVRVEADNSGGHGLENMRPSNATTTPRVPRSRLMLLDDWDSVLQLWWAKNFSEQLYFRITASTGIAGSLLFLLSMQIGISESAGVFIRFISGFLGLVLCAVSLGIGAWLFSESGTMQSQILPYWSKLIESSVRWLRQPTHL